MNVLFCVHNELGTGLLEKHYQRAIEVELLQRNIRFEKEKQVNLFFKDALIGKYFIDFLIENKIVIEIKTTPAFQKRGLKQAYSYLRQLHLPLAIVVNFHDKKLRYQRIVNPEYKSINLQED